METAPKTRIVNSVAWSVATKWSSKLIGMVNTIVLARLLSPEDFGIVAMATVVLAMLESTTEVGIRLFVIRSKDTSRRLYDAGWTVGVIQAFVIAFILLLSAPFIAEFFGEEAVKDIVYCLCIIRLVNGLKSFCVIIAQKDLNFSIGFKLTFISRCAYLAASVIAAIVLENYWAIVIGQFVAAFVGLIVSYAIHPYRPRLDLYNWRGMLKFSSHTMPMSIGRFVNNQLHVIVIARVAPTEYLGTYNVGANLGTLFTKQLMAPLIAGLVPNLSILTREENFLHILRLTIAMGFYCFLPIGVGLSLVAPEVVLVLLGEQWIKTTDILFWLSLYGMTSGILMFISEQFLVIINREKLSNLLMWMRNLLLVICLAVALLYGDYLDIPAALFASAAIAVPLTLLFVARTLEISVWFIVSQWWPAVTAAGAMAATLILLPWPQWPALALLLIKCLCAAAAYLSTLALLYVLRGRPGETPEALFEEQLLKRIRRRRAQ